MMSSAHSQSGFTLLELLVAIAIFSVLAMAAYSGLDAVLQARSNTLQRAERLNALQRTFNYLGEDLQQLINRPVRDELGSERPALVMGQGGDLQLELTRSGWQNPTGVTRSLLQRVSYLLEDDKLVRQYYYHLDNFQGARTRRQLLLDRIKEIEWRFMDSSHAWQDRWPSLNNSNPSNTPALPLAVEVTFTLEDWGKLVRLFEVPG